MKIREVVALLDAKVFGNKQMLENEVEFAFSSDLMSDVLTVKTQNVLLLTGLANIQSLRTAEMSDVINVIYVRGKRITDDMKELAEENGILLMECNYSMYKASGILYKAGIKPIY
jgi:predicted transcriptional regulator